MFVGGAWAQETPKNNFTAMSKLLSEAKGDLEKSVQMNEKSLYGYLYLIEMYKNYGDLENLKRIHNDGIKNLPYSYSIRDYYVSAISPRWGGSYAMMEEYLKTIDQSAEINPAIWSLKGKIYRDQATLLINNKKYKEAIEVCTKLKNAGDIIGSMANRSQCYMFTEQWELAINDINILLTYLPNNIRSLENRSYCYIKMNKRENAILDYAKLLELKPNDLGYLYSRGYSYIETKQFERGLEDFNAMLRVDPNNGKAYLGIGLYYSNIGDKYLRKNNMINLVFCAIVVIS